jgi:hypothetical protein
MNAATLNIGTALTIVTDNSVYVTKLSNLLVVASKYKAVDLKGIAKTEKLKKYLDLMTSNGYSIISENWNRENTIADGVSDFSFTLSK